jgi:hypothetical protein
MTDASSPKPPRVLLTSFPDSYALPARPGNASAAVLDAHRQTGFLLSEEMATFERAMSLQLRIIAENAKVRGASAAAMFTLWSRTFSHLGDACELMSRGSYVSCGPLARFGLEAIAVQRSLAAGEFAEYEEWFAGAVSQDKTNAALVIDRGNYKAASVLIADERLGLLYRLLTELSMPHFGSSLLLAAPETSLQKAPLAFAVGAFHLGWAELVTGWLLLLAGEQVDVVRECGVFSFSESLASEVEAMQRGIRDALANRRRCYAEDMGGRFVFHNFRRAASGQPKRVALG